MRKYIVPVLALALVCLSCAPADAALPAYGIQPTPDFAFIGDSVSFAVSGVPLSYVFLMVHPADNLSEDAVIADEFTQLDARGLATVNVTLAADIPAGEYIATLLADGAMVANATITVLFDFETWASMKLDYLDEELQAQQNLTRAYAIETARLADNMEQVKWFGLATLFFAGFSGVYLWVNRGDWRKWNISMLNKAMGFEATLKKTFYAWWDPSTPYGTMYDLNPGQEQAVRDVLDEMEKENKPVNEMYLIMPDKTASDGFRIHTVKDLADLTPKDDEKELAPAAEPVQQAEKDGASKPKRSKKAKPEPFKKLEVKPVEKGRFKLSTLFKSKKMETWDTPKAKVELEPEEEIEEEPEEKVIVPKPKPSAKKKSAASSKPTATKSAPKKRPAKSKTPKEPVEGSQ